MSPVALSPPPPDVEVDGRRRRGDASRRMILDASTQLIADQGVTALTHRSVATAAEVSVARVAYHFPGIDDLLVSASTDYLRAFDERLGAMAERARLGERSIVEVCTDLLYDLVTTRSREFLGMVEVRLALARRGRTVDETAITPAIRSFGADQARAEVIASALFGFAVLAASAPESVDRRRVRNHVCSVLGVQR